MYFSTYFSANYLLLIVNFSKFFILISSHARLFVPTYDWRREPLAKLAESIGLRSPQRSSVLSRYKKSGMWAIISLKMQLNGKPIPIFFKIFVDIIFKDTVKSSIPIFLVNLRTLKSA